MRKNVGFRDTRGAKVVSAVILVVMLVVITLFIVLVIRDPQGMGHLVAFIFTLGAKLLDGVAAIVNALVGGHAN